MKVMIEKLGSHYGDDRYRPYFIVDDEFGGNAKVCCPPPKDRTQKNMGDNYKYQISNIKKYIF